jgi:hypothetical protein
MHGPPQHSDQMDVDEGDNSEGGGKDEEAEEDGQGRNPAGGRSPGGRGPEVGPSAPQQYELPDSTGGGRSGGRGRDKGGMRGMGGSQHHESEPGLEGVNEAAEALIGLVAMSPASGNDEQAAGGGPARRARRFHPGQVVWAKVEGHDWWPAKIVRRRAVPREVRGA